MEPELNRHGSGHQCRSSAAAVVAVAIAAVGGDGTAGGFTAQAGCVMLGDYPRPRGGDLLAHRDVPELVGPVRVGMRTEHADAPEVRAGPLLADPPPDRAPTAPTPEHPPPPPT